MKESNDILVLFESLNNHEVFTPPRLAKQMLELFPEDVWTHPEYKFLDPCVKSGVFLREIFYKLFEGLEGKGRFTADDGITYDLNDNRQRINHIFKNMLYGIATSELTGYVSRRTLYGVMEADSDKQLSAIESFEQSKNFRDWTEQQKLDFIGRNQFNDYYDHTIFKTKEYEGFEKEGNIFYPTNEVNQIVAEEGNFIIEDTYFPFIDDRTKHRKILDIKEQKMKFDVIIGNPPYQIDTNGYGRQAKPIYHKFVEQSINMMPKYVAMITPSRWFSGGMGLDTYRKQMMSDKRMKAIVDFPNSKDCFPGVSISGGVNYFLWDKSHDGDCQFTSIKGMDSATFKTNLNEYPVIVRYAQSKNIINKIKYTTKESFSSKVQSINAFNLPSSFRGDQIENGNDCKVLHSQGFGYAQSSALSSGLGLLDKYKVIISRTVAEHANEPSKDGTFKVLAKTLLLGPKEVCTHSYLVAAVFDSRELAENCLNFLQTKIVRFLILQSLAGIDLSKERFMFVPDLDMSIEWSDERLYEKYGLSEDEIAFVDLTIKAME